MYEKQKQIIVENMETTKCYSLNKKSLCHLKHVIQKIKAKKESEKCNNFTEFYKESERIVRSVLEFQQAGPFKKMEISTLLHKDYLRCNPRPIFLGICNTTDTCLCYRKRKEIAKRLERGDYKNFGAINSAFNRLWYQEDKIYNTLKNQASISKEKRQELLKRFAQFNEVKNYYEIMASPFLKAALLQSSSSSSTSANSTVLFYLSYKKTCSKNAEQAKLNGNKNGDKNGKKKRRKSWLFLFCVFIC
ncbi:hypothetical protein RFI_24390 [Reticulomyxa filosa]|uniref:Uncharacterized protein n=1 Tax=Reticulomyxa filosa TaxID=46433 RepID=X6MGH7_RETFI|nr:hypothetical protein RFI_24390 [Reticulomyxa filosa]|eukprot:ETO12984.1 hypothetical protein RFI_24390 [Reticulomyxa filosa]